MLPGRQEAITYFIEHLLCVGIIYIYLHCIPCTSYVILETGSHYLDQTGFKHVLVLSQPRKHWDYSCGPTIADYFRF